MATVGAVVLAGAPGKPWFASVTCNTTPQPTRHPRFKDMPGFWHAHWQEHLVGPCAQELWHLYSRKPHGREQEFECERVEYDAIDACRKYAGYPFTPPGTPP